MRPEDKEQERLKRIHEQQLADRDPLIKQRQFQRQSAQRERKARRAVTLAGMWKEIPSTWKGFTYGITLGTILLFILPMFWISSWAVPCSAISIVVFGLSGVLVGRALDTRDNIKDLMK